MHPKHDVVIFLAVNKHAILKRFCTNSVLRVSVRNIAMDFMAAMLRYLGKGMAINKLTGFILE
jgi:hypothetical protein